eukprot:CAMPEP_0179418792 /NCGR_PEP_ID=MMETSP0799-20121207/8230_1 /TAXON_ID=46947 /ORGANISM="Geminigera cryophila, Strain CCMP2564" /LENGTH=57 /DNA_ID=CAMNT_0021192173 /DNA_START=492 /DNA_END=662 /DNA_ORIENTATION=-
MPRAFPAQGSSHCIPIATSSAGHPWTGTIAFFCADAALSATRREHSRGVIRPAHQGL